VKSLVKALFLLPLLPSLLLAGEVVQRPALQAGDFWLYQVSHRDWIDYDSRAIRSGEYELYHDGSRLRVFRLGQGMKIEVHGRAEGELPRMLGIFDRPNQLLEFPLVEGKRWQSKFKGGGRGRVRPIYTDNLVTGTKKIATPAGAFDALRIERDDRDRRVNTREYYYVAECGCIGLYSREITSHPTTWPRRYYGKREIILLKFGSRN
jgi:hypothetical protein